MVVERELQTCLSSLSSCFWEKNNTGKSHRSAREVWVDSDILDNFSRNGGYVVLVRSHSVPVHMNINLDTDSINKSFIGCLISLVD